MSSRHHSERDQLLAEYEAHRKSVHAQCRDGQQKIEELEARNRRLVSECTRDIATLTALLKNQEGR
jgi:hypothetical protein